MKTLLRKGKFEKINILFGAIFWLAIITRAVNYALPLYPAIILSSVSAIGGCIAKILLIYGDQYVEDLDLKITFQMIWSMIAFVIAFYGAFMETTEYNNSKVCLILSVLICITLLMVPIANAFSEVNMPGFFTNYPKKLKFFGKYKAGYFTYNRATGEKFVKTYSLTFHLLPIAYFAARWAAYVEDVKTIEYARFL